MKKKTDKLIIAVQGSNSITEAAEKLGISRQYLHLLIKNSPNEKGLFLKNGKRLYKNKEDED